LLSMAHEKNNLLSSGKGNGSHKDDSKQPGNGSSTHSFVLLLFA
jgi:hypothetical protein